ncbi:MAG: ribonuclease P protein component, partial [OM182 bacterium]|nr:ribonuclease P protein component [OM182 bacterium]MDP4782000.1 ribonuclease P protein component [Gammaproteobacteria bacterium]MDP4941902.1 ribonuclease P protein component [OM182 bacterium]
SRKDHPDHGGTMSTEAFPKTARLLNARDYKPVFDHSRYKVSNKHFLFLATASQARRPRIGLVIAKKHIPKAVQRNRLKRALREAFRLHQANIPLIDIVVLARKDADKLPPVELRSMINKLIDDIITREARDTKEKDKKATRQQETLHK